MKQLEFSFWNECIDLRLLDSQSRLIIDRFATAEEDLESTLPHQGGRRRRSNSVLKPHSRLKKE